MTRRTTVTAEFDVGDDGDAATVRKLLTPRGQLVEIESADRTGADGSNTIRVDALGLESLSWQTESELADRLGRQPPADWNAAGENAADANEVDGPFAVSNEYADVEIAKATTADGDALVVRAPVKRTEIRLPPAMVGALTARDTSLFSEFLETPHGPHDH
ncbi:hypothetical protein SAMN05192561_13011 [Halopenitus malekzadehii]|uniref:Uncharacterized protein n=1 Tax=Halopenitus malekzadehii TaxID=1267564 RepID=A0A1H6JZE0_9EURY|nr:hypothetical protein [Halopenitus malekzadehii]SEH67863.1 hypothetical protein SAMN05192561_13011 [Halopenitus malekzadehii]